ncbi:hypothetical protein FRC07_008320 [Ceratobasidium sp. 392]|nr:hypothetical protein FRC07_008320 [Ceratobasidium sp. 392]
MSVSRATFHSAPVSHHPITAQWSVSAAGTLTSTVMAPSNSHGHGHSRAAAMHDINDKAELERRLDYETDANIEYDATQPSAIIRPRALPPVESQYTLNKGNDKDSQAASCVRRQQRADMDEDMYDGDYVTGYGSSRRRERKVGEVVVGIPKLDEDERYGHALEDLVRAGEPGEAEDENGSPPARDYARQHDRNTSGIGVGMGDSAGAEDSLLREEGPFADVHASEWDRQASYATLPTPGTPNMEADGTPVLKSEKPKPVIQKVEETRVRKVWKAFVFLCTWWIPSFLLFHLGRMKRPDVQQAWREKVTICMLIFGACGGVIFYIIIFGKLLCPELDKAWNVD